MPPLSLAAESLQSLIDQANTAAEKQDYPTAIRLYEQVIPKTPGDKTLKNNLAILYANYGVTLQEQKKYEQALGIFDKATALVVPGTASAHSISEVRAGVYFAQAMDLKDAKENLTAEDYGQMRALLEKALAVNGTEPAYKKAMAGSYMEEAYGLASQEKYADAIPLLEKGLAYSPDNANLKQSLANVYLGMAKQNVNEREQWLEKALATDNSPPVQQAAQRLRNLGKAAADGGAGFAANPNEARAGAPPGLSSLSVAEMVRDMEAQLQVSPPQSATLNDRVETLEKQVLGKKQDGALATRTKAVYTALMGTVNGTSLSESNPNLMQAPPTNAETSYLGEIFKVTDGKVIRWGKFPLRVYFEEPGKEEAKAQPLYKTDYKAAALAGFKVWKDQTDGFANYVEIQNPAAADIVVSWQEDYVDRFADPARTPTVYKNYTPPKQSQMLRVLQVASMFAPGYFYLAPQALAAGIQYKQAQKLEVIRDESRIHLGLAPTKDLSPEAARQLIQNMAAKEFGHALGLKGSSDKPGDLLYPELRSDAAQLPTNRDLATLKDLYNRPPNIILNVR